MVVLVVVVGLVMLLSRVARQGGRDVDGRHAMLVQYSSRVLPIHPQES